ncbi:glycerol-3-phosphate phosphatase-like isoform X3 [Centruroides sculpturatus]|uniref:glycerol-3-phosphate phosphatase-like isoform X2 n=2 Tax=Centruroides sculpturatus TaxID=218467 RepID=UPI000C6EA5D8|nr:glycerol-3-phosphate phosphatase-like isoform X2 [Centruroides sculpturatus]XP_023219298.1 glycerol-3-phosphate phosphatase-like isoform X3 [Centruroides sculpturatus]
MGISSLPVGPEPMSSTWTDYIENVTLDPEVGAVIACLDEQFNFLKLLKACSYLRNPDCLFLATNIDEAFPVIKNLIVPGTGPVVAAINNVTKRNPIICGKPYSPIFEAVQSSHPDLNPNRCIMIGDRLDSDILLGKNNNLKTLLVLTGTHNLKDIEEFKKSKKLEEQNLVPDYYIQSLGELGKLLKL